MNGKLQYIPCSLVLCNVSAFFSLQQCTKFISYNAAKNVMLQHFLCMQSLCFGHENLPGHVLCTLFCESIYIFCKQFISFINSFLSKE